MFESAILNIHSNKKTPYTVREISRGRVWFSFSKKQTFFDRLFLDNALHYSSGGALWNTKLTKAIMNCR